LAVFAQEPQMGGGHDHVGRDQDRSFSAITVLEPHDHALEGDLQLDAPARPGGTE
jgi:hypothetical protein